MTKLFFPFLDQPKEVSCRFSKPIKFPFYVNDLVYYWEVGSDGITVYLLNNQIDPNKPIVKDIILEENGISIYLVNERTNTSKHILVDFDKIGMGIETLGLLDPFLLKDIDPFTLGHISVGCADWMQYVTSAATVGAAIDMKASNAHMELESDCVLPYDKHVFTGNLHETLGIVGLFNADHMTLGDLDPHIFSDIDLMLSAFRVFNNIPAELVKEIRITHTNRIDNGIMCAFKDFSAKAVGIDHYIRSDCIVTALRNVNARAFDVELNISVSYDKSADTIVSKSMSLSVHQSSITNGSVSLVVQSDETTA